MDNGARPGRARARSARRGSSASTPGPSRRRAPTTLLPRRRRRARRRARAGEATADATSPTRRRAPGQTLPGDGDGGRLEGPAAVRLDAGRRRQGPRLRRPRRSPQDVVIAGPSSLDLYLKSSARDTDLQVTLSEVRPDGKETYVQNGWLRASHRKLDAQLLDRDRPGPDAPEAATPRRCRAGKLRARARADLPGRPRVPRRARRSASRSRRRAATARAGTSPRSTRARRATRVALGGARASQLVLPVSPGATAKGTPLPAPDRAARRADRPTSPASNGG